jgi:hypothetical protein
VHVISLSEEYSCVLVLASLRENVAALATDNGANAETICLSEATRTIVAIDVNLIFALSLSLTNASFWFVVSIGRGIQYPK